MLMVTSIYVTYKATEDSLILYIDKHYNIQNNITKAC